MIIDFRVMDIIRDILLVIILCYQTEVCCNCCYNSKICSWYAKHGLSHGKLDLGVQWHLIWFCVVL
jgi:hypothetical protein